MGTSEAWLVVMWLAMVGAMALLLSGDSKDE